MNRISALRGDCKELLHHASSTRNSAVYEPGSRPSPDSTSACAGAMDRPDCNSYQLETSMTCKSPQSMVVCCSLSGLAHTAKGCRSGGIKGGGTPVGRVLDWSFWLSPPSGLVYTALASPHDHPWQPACSIANQGSSLSFSLSAVIGDQLGKPS